MSNRFSAGETFHLHFGSSRTLPFDGLALPAESLELALPAEHGECAGDRRLAEFYGDKRTGEFDGERRAGEFGVEPRRAGERFYTDDLLELAESDRPSKPHSSKLANNSSTVLAPFGLSGKFLGANVL